MKGAITVFLIYAVMMVAMSYFARGDELPPAAISAEPSKQVLEFSARQLLLESAQRQVEQRIKILQLEAQIKRLEQAVEQSKVSQQ